MPHVHGHGAANDDWSRLDLEERGNPSIQIAKYWLYRSPGKLGLKPQISPDRDGRIWILIQAIEVLGTTQDPLFPFVVCSTDTDR